MGNNYKVIILVGASGSGKTTKAAQLQEQANKSYLISKIVSADNFFCRHGKYSFDASQLGFANDYCKVDFAEAIAARCPLIIVDNTNTSLSERYFYKQLALRFDYQIELMYMDEENPETLAVRNVHNVPIETIKKQLERIQKSKAAIK